MRKTLLILLTCAGLSACGGSGSSSITTVAGSGSFLSSTVQLDQQFVYALSTEQNQLVAYKIGGEEEGGHDHDHVHAQEDDHGHEHEGEASTFEAVELDGSPYTLPGGQALVLTVVAQGRALIVLFADGTLRNYPIDGVTGLLGEPVTVNSGLSAPRKLRVAPDGDAIAVLGENLALFPLSDTGELAPLPAVIGNTEDWSDVTLAHHGGVGATQEGAVGFSWEHGGPAAKVSEVSLPGAVRGGLALAHEEVFVTNTEDQTVSQLAFDEETGDLQFVATYELPEELADPSTITALYEGEDLLVGGSQAAVLLHHHDGELEEEGHAELEETPSDFFALPDSAFVLVAQAAGHGFHVLGLDGGLSVVAELEHELEGFTSFGLAQRSETVTVSQGL